MIVSPHTYERRVDPDAGDSLSHIARRVPPGSRVLELGPATGYFTRYLKEILGCRVDAVEFDGGMAERARPWCDSLVIGDLDALDLADHFPPACHDVVICADVLEHLRSPEALLRQLPSMLRDGGRLLISVPNVAYAGVLAGLLEDDFAYRDEGILDRTHLHFFTRSTLTSLLQETGWYPWAWASVEKSLLDSEFHTRLEAWPPCLADHLVRRSGGLCYQWVVEARREPPLASPECFVPSRFAERFPIRLLWRATSADEYCFPASDVAWGTVGEMRQVLNLSCPVAPLGGLRLGLSDREGFVRLHRLVWRDEAGQVAWQWHSGDVFPWRASAALKVAENSRNGVVLGVAAEDWLELPVPEAARETPGQLEVELDWPMSADYRAAREGWEREVARARGDLSAAHALIAERDALLALRTEQMQACERLVAERDEWLDLRTRQMQERESLIAERDSQLEARARELVQLSEQLAASHGEIVHLHEQVVALRAEVLSRDRLHWWVRWPLRRLRHRLGF